MEVLQEIIDRRSIRKYKDTEVTRDEIMTLLEAARLAPSGSNQQAWDFIVVTDKTTQEKIVQADHNQKWMLTAPVMIACIVDVKKRNGEEHPAFVDENVESFTLKKGIRDCSLAIENIMLQATHMGLGTCYTGWYEQKDMREALNLPEDLYVAGVLTVGVPDEEPAMRPRRELEDIVHFERW